MYKLAIKFPNGSTTCSSDCDFFAKILVWPPPKCTEAVPIGKLFNPHPLPEHAHMCTAMYHNHFISPNGVVGRQVSRHRLPTDILRRERKSAERTWLKTLTDVVCFCCLANVRSLLFFSQKLEILARQAISPTPPSPSSSLCTTRTFLPEPKVYIYIVYQKCLKEYARAFAETKNKCLGISQVGKLKSQAHLCHNIILNRSKIELATYIFRYKIYMFFFSFGFLYSLLVRNERTNAPRALLPMYYKSLLLRKLVRNVLKHFRNEVSSLLYRWRKKYNNNTHTKS